MNSSEIGGFIEFHSTISSLPHKEAIATNSGGNALRYILRTLDIHEIAIPRYICQVVPEILDEEGCSIIPYSIDEEFYPHEDIPADLPLLYVNYWGIHGRQSAFMAQKCPRLILDCSQAFFAPAMGWATFYSPRKFFGVPDGGYAVVPEGTAPLSLERDQSFDRCQHLLLRADGQCEAAYALFRENEAVIRKLPLRSMSFLTVRMLGSIDFVQCAKLRRENFFSLHERLNHVNKLLLSLDEEDVPLVYPLLTDHSGLREKLIKEKIFLPQYWPCPSIDMLNPFEKSLVQALLPLPIDQRYSLDDMNFITKSIEKHL